MKYLIIISLLISLLSCKDDGCMHPDKINRHPEFYGSEIEYIEKYCPKCNGVGKVELTTGERVLWGVVTFGGGFMFETMECSMCNGSGVIKVKKLKNN